MSVSEFRKKKLIYLFTTFFDVNKSGQIDKKDFELAIDKLTTLRNWKAGSAQHKKVQDTLLQVWDGLQKAGDADGDGQVSQDEWIKLWSDYPKNQSPWQNLYSQFIFDLEDASGDGSIDVDEFKNVLSSYGVQASEAEQAFQKLSSGKKELSLSEFQTLFKQFFTSENAAEPGNFIFGKTAF